MQFLYLPCLLLLTIATAEMSAEKSNHHGPVMISLKTLRLMQQTVDEFKQRSKTTTIEEVREAILNKIHSNRLTETSTSTTQAGRVTTQAPTSTIPPTLSNQSAAGNTKSSNRKVAQKVPQLPANVLFFLRQMSNDLKQRNKTVTVGQFKTAILAQHATIHKLAKHPKLRHTKTLYH